MLKSKHKSHLPLVNRSYFTYFTTENKVILTGVGTILEMGFFIISSRIPFFFIQALVQLPHIHIHCSRSLRSRLQEAQIQIVFKSKLPLWFHHIKPLLRSNLWNEKRFLIHLPQMGYNSPGPESCRIRNSQTPLTHPWTHMQGTNKLPNFTCFAHKQYCKQTNV